MNYLSLKAHSRVYQFALEDIYYIRTIKEHKIEVVTIDWSYSFSLISLTEIELEVPQLFRCHRNCLVNIHQINMVDKKTRFIYFRHPDVLPIICARARLKSLLALLRR